MDVTSTGYIKIKNAFVSKDIIKMMKRLCFVHFSQKLEVDNGKGYRRLVCHVGWFRSDRFRKTSSKSVGVGYFAFSPFLNFHSMWKAFN